MHSKMNKWMMGALVAAGALTGCVDPLPRLDEKLGDAVNMAKAQQTINPDASRNTDPVVGLDGQAAKSVIDRYQKSYQSPPPPVNVITIGVGSGAGSR